MASQFDCEVPGTNHSPDMIEVWRGDPTPYLLCGYHAAWGQRAYDVVRAQRANPAPPPPPPGTWEPIREFDGDRGRILYWAYVVDGQAVGAYSRKPEGWRALMYRPHRTPEELGMYPSWFAARRAVQRAAAAGN